MESGSIIAAENIRGHSSSDLQTLVQALTKRIMLNFPLNGYIVKKSPKSVIIDLGLTAGLNAGTEFIVYKEGAIIKHPKTGEVLDVEQIHTGRIRIKKVRRNVAEGVILSAAFLFIFMPVITQTGGNAGSQSSTLMIHLCTDTDCLLIRLLWY